MKLLIPFTVVVLFGVGVFWYQKLSSHVPPLTEESFIRTFFAEINAGEIPSAVSRLSKKNIPDDSANTI